MNNQFAHIDTALILESLKFKQMKCDNTRYETYELKQKALKHVTNVSAKIRASPNDFLLTSNDLDLILESLEDTKLNFQSYNDYPTTEFKQGQLERVSSAIEQVKALQILNKGSK